MSAATWPCLPSLQNLKQRAAWYGDTDRAAAEAIWVQKQYMHTPPKVGFTILSVVGLIAFRLLSCCVGREHMYEHGKLCITLLFVMCQG